MSPSLLSSAVLHHQAQLREKIRRLPLVNPLDNPEGQAGDIRASLVPQEDESAWDSGALSWA